MDMFRNLGLALRVLRELQGKNQAQVARAIGSGKSQLSCYENGRTFPKFDVLAKILKELDVTPLSLFYVMSLLDRQQTRPEKKVDPAMFALPEAFCLSSDTRDSFSSLIQAFFGFYTQLVEERLKTTPPRPPGGRTKGGADL